MRPSLFSIVLSWKVDSICPAIVVERFTAEIQVKLPLSVPLPCVRWQPNVGRVALKESIFRWETRSIGRQECATVAWSWIPTFVFIGNLADANWHVEWVDVHVNLPIRANCPDEVRNCGDFLEVESEIEELTPGWTRCWESVGATFIVHGEQHRGRHGESCAGPGRRSKNWEEMWLVGVCGELNFTLVMHLWVAFAHRLSSATAQQRMKVENATFAIVDSLLVEVNRVLCKVLNVLSSWLTFDCTYNAFCDFPCEKDYRFFIVIFLLRIFRVFLEFLDDYWCDLFSCTGEPMDTTVK